MPLLAAIAVALNTAMVLVVWSVMGGFLTMLLSSGRSLMGDAAVAWPVVGIPYYEDLIDRLEARDEIAAATGTIESAGMLGLPDGSVRLVTVVGVDGPAYNEVTAYEETIWWAPLEEPIPRDADAQDPRLDISAEYLEEGLTLTEVDPETGEPRAAVAPGIWVSGYNERDPRGWNEWQYRFLPDASVTLSVLPLSQRGVAIDTAARRFPVANEFQSGLYEWDANIVLARRDALQDMLDMDAAERIDEDFDFTAGGGDDDLAEPEVVGVEPARVTHILIRGVDGVSPVRTRDVADEVYREFAAARGDEVPNPDLIQVYTWEERPGLRNYIAAVRNEIALVVGLFAFIATTAIFLVFAIFWAMVSEKVKDVGILRSMGASRLGVAWIWVRYGALLGAAGALAGGALAVLIVWNINPIHSWLSSTLNVTVWDPSVYVFPKIPNDVDPVAALMVVTGGVVFSVVGALAPAAKAARMDPVRALRFE